MAHQTLKFRITGEAPLLMHNGQLGDPLNKWTKAIKAISGKRKKTDADIEEIARLEWYGGLYLKSDTGKPCIPGEVLEATFISGAKKSKQGTNAKMGVFCKDDYEIHFGGDRLKIEELWNSGNYRLTKLEKVNGRVLRTRPKFSDWYADCEIVYDDEVFSQSEMWEILETSGRIGTMDWRPKYGRFTVSRV